MEITVLNLFNPTQGIFDTCKVIFSRKGKKTVCEIAIDVAHQVLALLHVFGNARVIIGQIFLVQDTETTTEAVGVLTDPKNRIVVLS